MPLNLELGDIIIINAPTDSLLNNKTFLINYIDSKRLSIINSENTTIITIDDEGNLDNESITSIELISREEKQGYARQNDLMPDTWIDITVKTDVPTIITGLITNIEEDMIEVLSWPKQEMLYFDFEYKGILFYQDKESFITIEKREPPRDYSQSLKEEELSVSVDDDTVGIKEEDILMNYNVKEKLDEIILDADAITFGEDLGSITQEVDVEQDAHRYSIDAQTNDMLDDFLADIPTTQRSRSVIKHIHTIIERYKQLRYMYSEFDSLNNPTKPLIKGANYKPLYDELTSYKHDLRWIIPVIKNYKKVYDILDDSDDTVVLSLSDSIHQENKAYDDVKGTPDGSNLYKKLYNELNTFYTPYNSANPYESMENIKVQHNINALASNLEPMVSSVIDKNVLHEKFMRTVMVTKGLDSLDIVDRKGQSIITEVKQMTPSDTLSVIGLCFSNNILRGFASVPSSTIMTKSLIDRTSNYTLDKKNINEQTITQEDLADPKAKIEFNRFGDINNIILIDEQLYGQENIYSKYLNHVIPRIKDSFNLVKKDLNYPVSFHNVVKQLEPFKIYHNDITFIQYKEIQAYVHEQIGEYKKKYASSKSDYNRYANLKNHIFDKYRLPHNVENEPKLMENYNFQGKDLSLTYNKKLEFDNGEFFYSVLRLKNSHLYSKVSVDEEIKSRIEQLERDRTTEDDEACVKHKIAKAYPNKESMEQDNRKELYFDKKYDDTQYDILKEYPQSTMTDEQYVAFIADNLKANIGLNDEEARFDATSMFEGKRKVRVNDLALLHTPEGTEYYERKSDMWVINETIMKFKNNKDLCNIQDDCIYLDKKCQSLDHAEKFDEETELNIIIGKIVNEQEISDAELIKQFEQDNKVALHNIELLKASKTRENKTTIKNKIASELSEGDIIQPSPYSEILNLILADGDFVRKLMNLTLFSQRFLVEKEKNPYMLFCKDTGIALLPTFLIKLSDAYFNDMYETVLDEICKEQGVISDDGDKWVDKHSGFTIKMIEFDVEEGYDTSGFKIVSREMVEMEESSKTTYDNPLSQQIFDILISITNQIGVDLSASHEFIVSNTTLCLNDYVPKKETYLIRSAQAKKQGKKLPSYDFIYNNTLLILILTFIHISIQTQIPMVKIKKSFPNCAKSFSGFPLVESESDLTGIQYISCVANKLKSKVKVWYTILKMNEESIAKKILTICKKVITRPDVAHTLSKKREHDKTAVSTDPIYSLEDWNTFLPFLGEHHQTHITKLADSFFTDFEKEKLYDESKLNLLVCKNFYLSLAIQNTIQTILNKEDLLLKSKNGIYFLENACCNNDDKHTLNYFKKREKSIEEHMIQSYYYTDKINTYNGYNKSIFINNTDETRLVYPEMSNTFSEETIYLAFIYFCKFNSGITLDENLIALCQSNEADFETFQPLSEKIEAMKSKGLNYSLNDFYRLVNYINNQNMVSDVGTDTAPGKKDIFMSALPIISENEYVDTPLGELFQKVFDVYDTKYKDHKDVVDALNDYLLTRHDELISSITLFLELNGKDRSDVDRVKRFFHDIKHIHEIESDVILTKDNTTVRFVNFVKNVITDFFTSSNNIIKNKIDYSSVNVPGHWNLSQRHNSDIQLFVYNTYKKLKQFYENDELIDFFDSHDLSVFMVMVNITPFDFSKSDDENDMSLFNFSTTRNVYYYYLLFALNIMTMNDSMSLKPVLADLITVYCDLLSESFKTVNLDKTSIYEKVLFSKEKEKDEITLYLKELTEEERKIENELKKNKLGKWNKGITKGVVEYVGDVYDSELHELERKAMIDRKAESEGVSAENRHIYMDDFEEQFLSNHDIEQEVNDLSHLADDDDFGENDGDENY